VISTALALPRSPGDITSILTIVFVGPGKFDPKRMGPMLKVQKEKVWNFLMWLKSNNKLYRNMEINCSLMDLYPDDGILPGIEDRIIHDSKTDPSVLFNKETAGFTPHLASLVNEGSVHSIILESMGMSDPECSHIQGHTFTASALQNLVPRNSSLPDLANPHGDVVCKYDNPDLFPGMYPTLFPFGIGGFDDHERATPVGFQAQAEYYLDICDWSFRYHCSFIFVALNIHQRRTAHIQTSLTVQREHFLNIAHRLLALTPDLLDSLASHLEQESKISELQPVQKDALELLQRVNTISAHIPSSQASKILAQNKIRSYFGLFGLPHIYLTLNPCATHSPIFQVICGDTSIDLTERYPVLVHSGE
jgi:hypothetical protein